nr:RING-H2 finger protein ATL79-like protein [Lilium hybrid division I]
MPLNTNLLFPSPPAPPLPAPLSPSPPLPSSRWGPYTSAKDFEINMGIVILVLVGAAIIGFSLIAVIGRLCRRHRTSKQTTLRNTSLSDALPTVVFTPGTRMTGTAAECFICLTDFVVGDEVKVLPACNHGFHGSCVSQWLCSKDSCPTCRGSCRPVAPPPESLPEEP